MTQMPTLKLFEPGLYPSSTSIPDLTDKIIREDDGQRSAAGGFSDVFRCRLGSTSVQEVAVKAFRFRVCIDDLDRKRGGENTARLIRQELGVWGGLCHRNIVPFLGITYGFGIQRSASLVSTWMPHGTLHAFLENHGDRLVVAHRLQLLLDIANGLNYLHSIPLIHGNLTSNNVLLDDNYNARLADAGCALLIRKLPEGVTYLNTSNVRPGTLRWAAPEYFSFDEEETKPTIKSDIYSFGNLAFLTFSGKFPWSEVPNDATVMWRLSQGLKPGRPLAQAIDDQHWAFIERCWLPMLRRPLSKDIISSLRHFLDVYYPPRLHDLLAIPTSSHSVANAPWNNDLNKEHILNQRSAASLVPDVADTGSLELADHEVKALLDKLTTENFDTVSDQIIDWANKSENERDGRTLLRVTMLVYDRATDEAAQSEMYALLCRKMMETISPEVQDDNTRDAMGGSIAGGQLFKKHLLNRCQEDFERSWTAKGSTATAVAARLYNQTVMVANQRQSESPGITKFIGELFKLQMLTERVMHECVKKLLDVENPEEEEIKSLCQLLETVGQLLDVPKARAHMNVYFTRMKELCKSPDANPHMQLMLQDVIELRDRKWVARSAVIAPTTIFSVHEAAVAKKAVAEAQNYYQYTVPRGRSRRGKRNVESGPDGLTTRSQAKAGDLSQFGKISKAAPMVMGPSSIFAKKDPKRNPLSWINWSSNIKPSVSLNQDGSPHHAFDGVPEAPVLMSEADAKMKIDEDVKEFFAVRSMEEADAYFTNLPKEHRFHLVDKLVGSALESKEADAVLVAEFFTRASSKGQCSPEVLEAGFMPMAELLDDIAIDAPNAFKFMAIMLKGAGFDKDEERLGRLAGKSMDSDKLLQLVSP